MSSTRLATVFLCLYLCIQQSYLSAQDKSKTQFGKVTPADFTITSSLIDSNSHVVVLLSQGDLRFIGNNQNWFSPVFKRQEKIKILDKTGLRAAAIEIRLYAPDGSERQDKLNDITATTYNLENGKVVETRLDKKDIFKKRTNKQETSSSFSMPAVKVGSIIEYSYTITYDQIDDIPDWVFQSDRGPVLWSELNVEIPQTMSYAAVKQGIHPFNIDNASSGSQTYKVIQKTDYTTIGAGSVEKSLYVSVTTLKHRWVMKDLPGFYVENYISTPDNYLDKLQFQLAGWYNGDQKEEVNRTWQQATEDWLRYSWYFGSQIDDNDWLDDLTQQATANAAGQLAQARGIYYYVSSHFTCTDHDDPYVGDNLKDVLAKHSGTTGGVNMLMLAMLRKSKIEADPVLLSTTGHGYVFVKYPMRERMNYSIVQARIDGKVYYLDASHPHLGFGRLPDDCYNGPARVISLKDSGFVYFNANDLKDETTTTVIITNSDKGGIEGSYQTTLGMQKSYDTRDHIERIGEDKYREELQADAGADVQLSNFGLDSLQKPEDPLSIHFDISVRPQSAPVIYFNPIISDGYRKNPFVAAERKYPVEMPYCTDYAYTLNMEVPEGYNVEELPKSVKVALNDTEGAFEYMIAFDGKNIQLRVRLKLNRALFPPEDYVSLRDFFAFIVKKESEQIVLKKK